MENWAPDGKGVVVAVIDSGVVANSNLQSAPKYDFSNGVAKKAAGGDLRFDAYGHGSHIASLIGNTGAADDAPYRGVAAGASVLALKVLDANGAGYTSNVIAAIEFCIANKYALKIDIINLSLGHPIYEPAESDPLVQAVERAVQAGMAVIVAAGNHGFNDTTGQIGFAGITSPGNAPSAITVGAVDAHGHTDTARRRRRALQLAWTNLVRWVRQTRCRRLGASTGGPDRRRQLSLDTLSQQRRFNAWRGSQLPDAERHQYGDGGGQRCRRTSSENRAAGDRCQHVDIRRQTTVLDGELDSESVFALRRLGLQTLQAGHDTVSAESDPEFSAIPIPGTHVLEQGAGELNPMGAFELAKRVSVADIEKRFQTNDFSFEGSVAFGTTPDACGFRDVDLVPTDHLGRSRRLGRITAFL